MTVEERIQGLLATGDTRGAAAEAIRGFGPRILGYLRSVLRDDGDAQEAFSVFAEHLWRGMGTFRGEASFRTWAFKIAWHAALSVRDDAWRRLGRRFETSEASRLAEEVRTRSGLRVERQRQALDVLRDALTPEEQTLLALRVDQRLAWDDIAQVLSTAEAPVEAATLRKRFERLKERLARLAREHGLVE